MYFTLLTALRVFNSRQQSYIWYTEVWFLLWQPKFLCKHRDLVDSLLFCQNLFVLTNSRDKQNFSSMYNTPVFFFQNMLILYVYLYISQMLCFFLRIKLPLYYFFCIITWFCVKKSLFFLIFTFFHKKLNDQSIQ